MGVIVDLGGYIDICLFFIQDTSKSLVKISSYLILSWGFLAWEGRGAGSSGGRNGSVRLLDRPDLTEPDSESVSGVPTSLASCNSAAEGRCECTTGPSNFLDICGDPDFPP